MVIKVKVNGEWIKVPCAVEEAPKDGQQYVRKDGDWSAVEIPEVDLSGIESSIETIETSINELDTNKASKTEVTEQINAAVASVYKVKGSVANYAALPTENVSIGDVYNLEDTGANYVATSTTPDWDKLSETVDLSGYLTKTEATSTYQPKGNYLTSVPEEYVTETELTAKGYATTTQVNTKLDSSAYTATDVLSKVKTVDGSDSGLDADLLDGKHGSEYALKTDIVEEAPKDGKQYVRQDGNWSKAEVSGGGMPEAPIDNKPYVRKDGEWVNMHDQYENEDIAELIFDILNRGTNTITQEEYDKFAAICPVGKMAYAHLSDEAMGNTTVEIAMNGIVFKMYNDDGGIMILSNNNYSIYTGHYSFALFINSDLSYSLQIGYGHITPETNEDTGEHYINIMDEIVAQGPDVNKQIGASAKLISGGDGTKFLSNSGEYKEIPSQSTFSDTSVNFEPSATYTDFPYQSRIALEGVTANDFVEVVFGINEALSGNYAPICLTENGYVTIYSKVSDPITIPTIIIHR